MRIILVEDDADIREVITEYLMAMGHMVDALGNGREALEQLRGSRTSYDVALVDWQLPGIGGRDVVQGITQAHPATAVIITTGLASTRIQHQIPRTPQVEILQKPFSLRDLHQRVLQIARLQTLPALRSSMV